MKKFLFILFSIGLLNTMTYAQTYCLTVDKVETTPTELRVNFILSSPSATVMQVDASFYITGSGGISGTSFVAGNAGSNYNIGGGQSYTVRNPAAPGTSLYYTFPVVDQNALATFSVDDVTDGNGVAFLVAGVPTRLTRDASCPINSVVLPVELLNFAAEKKGSKSVVKWETLGEKNIENFIIERSADGVNYKALGFEKPKAAQAEKRESYEFVDEQPEIGINYYRLQSKGVRKEDFKYSKVVSVDFGLGIKAKAFPNPFAAELSIEIDVEEGIKGEVTIDMFDTAGKQVLSKKINAEGRKLIFEVPTEGLVPGSYVIRVKNGSSTWQHKITKQ
jgi:Secretion system C-terminal sorting domain